MISIPYRIMLEERLILSRSSASLGQHETLDFIPGSAVSGCFAGSWYADWKKNNPADLFAIFHSGNVRFGDAHPADGPGLPTLPAPLCLHYPKSQSDDPVEPFVRNENGTRSLNTASISNLSKSEWHHLKRQPVQLREGWVGGAGNLVEVKHGHVLKSARDSAKGGRASSGQLFGYSFLEAGQAFVGEILVADRLSCIAGKIRDWIEVSPEGRRIQLGRSSRAEFGGCRIHLLEPTGGIVLEDDSDEAANDLRLLAISDLWFPEGLPTHPVEFHPSLRNYEWVPSRTFLRFRNYSPWNAFRGYPDPERQTISRGSVLTFKFDSSAGSQASSLTELRSSMKEDGIGIGLTEGLGRVLVNPSMLAGSTLMISSTATNQSKQSQSASRPESAFLDSIERRWIRHWTEVEADRLADELVETWNTHRPQPGKSQWSRIRHLARSFDSPQDFTKEFTGMVSSGASKWKWRGTARGTGEQTLGDLVAAAWEVVASRKKRDQQDPRTKVKGAMETAFLSAVAEAARRLRSF